MTKTLATAVATLVAASRLHAAPAYIGRIDVPVPDATHAAAADLDGDGALDLAAVSDVAGKLYVYYGRGDGTFRFPPEVHPTDRNPAFVALGDITDDGVTTLPDILVVTRQGAVAIAPNVNGDLSIFQNSGAAPGSGSPRFATSCDDLFLDGSGNRNGNQPGFALLADFNADLKLDIVAASEFGNSIQSLFQGYASADAACRVPSVCNFGFANNVGCTPVSTGSVNPAALVAGEFLPKINTNGKVDVVALNAGATPSARITYHLHLNPNTDKFTTIPSQSFTVGDGIANGLGGSMMVGDDLNGDGVLDLLVSDSLSAQISVLDALNPSPPLSNPAFSQPSREYPAGLNPVWIGTGEFLAGSATDPARDAVVANRAIDTVSVLPAPRADGSFLLPMCFAAGDGPRTISTGDFNGDGADDLLVTNDRSGSVSLLLARATPNAGFDTAYRRSTGGGADAIARGDVDGDGTMDVITLDQAAAEAAVLLGDGTAQFAEVAKRSPTAAAPTAVAAAALDADIFEDAVVLSPNPPMLTLLLAVGDGTLRDGGQLALPPGSAAMTVARLDADANVDIAVATDVAPFLVRLLLGAGDGTFPSTVDVAVSGAVNALVSSDFVTGSGTDLALLDAAAASVQILRNDGTGSFTPGSIVATGSPSPNAMAAGDIDGDTRPDLIVTHDGGEVVVLLGDGAGGLAARPAVTLPTTPLAPLVGEFTGTAPRDVAVVLPNADVLVVLPWESGSRNLVPSLATSYGTGIGPRAAVSGAFDSAAPGLDTIVIADGSDFPDTWTTTVLSSRRHDRFPYADAGPDRTLCSGAAAPTVGSPGRCYLDYSWSPAAGLSSSTVPQPVVTGSGGTYTVTVTSPSTGLQSTDTVTVTVAPSPAPDIQPNPAVYCSGGAPLLLDAGAGFASYRWSTGETTRTISVTPSIDTLYTVDVTNSAGCPGSASRNVTVGALPDAVVTVAPTSQCQGTPSTTFTADASATVPPPGSTLSFAWSFTDTPAPTGWSIASPNSALTSVVATAPFSPRQVTLRLVVTANPGGCTATRDFVLEVLPSGQKASIGNSLLALRTAPGVDLSWVANGSTSYSVYGVTAKAAIPTMLTAPNLLGTVTLPAYSHATTDTLRFYQAEGSCP